VSSLGSEALQIKINTNVAATIGDTNVELWCSYIKDGGDYIRNGLILVDDSSCIIRYATDIISIIHALNLIKC
jgi:hypothetical protein